MTATLPHLPHLKDGLAALRQRCPEVNAWLGAARVDVTALNARLGAGVPATDYTPWLADPMRADGVTLAVGCGLGAGLRLILERSAPGHRVVVLEPRPERLLACLGHTPLSADIASGRLIFVLARPEGLETARSVLLGAYARKALILRLDAPGQDPAYVEAAGMARAFLDDMAVNYTTFRAVHEAGIENELANLGEAVRQGSLLPLAGRAAGVGGLVVGAGPSATQVFAHLAELRKRTLIVCPLQGLPVLQRSGVAPHLCVGMDTHTSMLRLYDRLDPEFARHTTLIYNAGTQPEVVRRYPGPKLPLWLIGGVGTLLMRGQDLVMAAEGGNVSVAAVQVLLHFGCPRIGLAGIDLAWKGADTHAPGHHAQAGRAGHSLGDVTLKNLAGEDIHTTHAYHHAARCLTRVIAGSGVTFAHAYGGGIPLPGATVVPAGDLPGVLASEPGRLEEFLDALGRDSAVTRKRVRYDRDRSAWKSAFDAAESATEALSARPGGLDADGRAAFLDIQRDLAEFIRSNPVYLPALGLATAILETGEVRDLAGLRRLRERVLARMTEMDAAFAAW